MFPVSVKLKNCLLGIFFPLVLSGCLGEIPDSNNSQEERAVLELAEVYSTIEAVYEGVLTNTVDDSEDIPVALNLFVATTASGLNSDGQPRMVPVLYGYYQRLDKEDPLFDYFIPNVRFYEETGRIVLQSNANPMGQTNGQGFLSITGTLVDGELFARFSDNMGYRGELILERVED